MTILEGSAIQRTTCSIEEVRGQASEVISANGSQNWARITERAVKKGARKSMVASLNELATHALAQAAAAAKPQLQSASRTVLNAASSASENLAFKLLGLSKHARIAALHSMPHAHLAQLLAELEHDGTAGNPRSMKSQSGIVPIARTGV